MIVQVIPKSVSAGGLVSGAEAHSHIPDLMLELYRAAVLPAVPDIRKAEALFLARLRAPQPCVSLWTVVQPDYVLVTGRRCFSARSIRCSTTQSFDYASIDDLKGIRTRHARGRTLRVWSRSWAPLYTPFVVRISGRSGRGGGCHGFRLPCGLQRRAHVLSDCWRSVRSLLQVLNAGDALPGNSQVTSGCRPALAFLGGVRGCAWRHSHRGLRRAVNRYRAAENAAVTGLIVDLPDRGPVLTCDGVGKPAVAKFLVKCLRILTWVNVSRVRPAAIRSSTDSDAASVESTGPRAFLCRQRGAMPEMRLERLPRRSRQDRFGCTSSRGVRLKSFAFGHPMEQCVIAGHRYNSAN